MGIRTVLLFLVLASALAAGPVLGGACGTGTLQQFIDLGSTGCTSNLGVVFKNFTYSSDTTPASDVTLSLDPAVGGTDTSYQTILIAEWTGQSIDFSLSWLADTSAVPVDVGAVSFLAPYPPGAQAGSYTASGTAWDAANPAASGPVSFTLGPGGTVTGYYLPADCADPNPDYDGGFIGCAGSGHLDQPSWTFSGTSNDPSGSMTVREGIEMDDPQRTPPASVPELTTLLGIGSGLMLLSVRRRGRR